VTGEEPFIAAQLPSPDCTLAGDEFVDCVNEKKRRAMRENR
jgi:hypothetical protein